MHLNGLYGKTINEDMFKTMSRSWWCYELFVAVLGKCDIFSSNNLTYNLIITISFVHIKIVVIQCRTYHWYAIFSLLYVIVICDIVKIICNYITYLYCIWLMCYFEVGRVGWAITHFFLPVIAYCWFLSRKLAGLPVELETIECN